MRTIPLRPLRPLMHHAYAALLRGEEQMPPDVREHVEALMRRRNTAPDDEVDAIDAEIVSRTWWLALRPDEIARDVLRHHGWRSPLTAEQATVVVAALGEAGYPIGGNGAPDYPYEVEIAPVTGPERDRVVWGAARHWAEMASQSYTYVSFCDRRGYLPRPVQYDQPGSMHPQQRASLTLGPWADRWDECDPHAYVRRHTRRLILVR